VRAAAAPPRNLTPSPYRTSTLLPPLLHVDLFQKGLAPALATFVLWNALNLWGQRARAGVVYTWKPRPFPRYFRYGGTAGPPPLEALIAVWPVHSGTPTPRYLSSPPVCHPPLPPPPVSQLRRYRWPSAVRGADRGVAQYILAQLGAAQRPKDAEPDMTDGQARARTRTPKEATA
jgi:hypothetical protein